MAAKKAAIASPAPRAGLQHVAPAQPRRAPPTPVQQAAAQAIGLMTAAAQRTAPPARVAPRVMAPPSAVVPTRTPAPPTVAPVGRPAANGEAKEIMTLLKAQNEAIVELQAAVRKLESKAAKGALSTTRTRAEILDGAALKSEDPRVGWLGVEIALFPWERDKKTGELTVFPNYPPMNALVALPRDGDVGGDGAKQRNAGFLALHIGASEDGETFTGAPHYVSPDELQTLRCDAYVADEGEEIELTE